MVSFSKKVLAVVSVIKPGFVLSYAQVATLAGQPKASRAVGTILSKNTDKNIPCHRVIKSDGSVGVYNGLQGIKKEDLLKKEGVGFLLSGKVSLDYFKV